MMSNDVSRRSLLAATLGLLAFPAVAQARGSGASAVIQRYYRLINARRYGEAFNLWEISDSGTNALSQTRTAFAAGFRGTARVKVSLGAESEPEGAAGSIYVTVPVRITSYAKSGKASSFSGEYVLRRSNVDGGNPDWRIYSATLRRSG